MIFDKNTKILKSEVRQFEERDKAKLRDGA
jgi:hypothetical protein